MIRIILVLVGLLMSLSSLADKLPPKTLGVFVYPHFELLDVFGPLEMFGSLPDKIKIVIIAEHPGRVKSDQGTAIYAETDLQHAPHLDYLFIPGGFGSRQLVSDKAVLSWIKQRADKADLVFSVCTGSALLAKAGVLDHHRATTNKKAFQWVTEQGPDVQWVKHARWVEDGKFITSSGVAAGTDMSLQVIARLYGMKTSERVANGAEYIWNKDPAKDPFAIK